MQKYSGPWTDIQRKHLLRRTLFGVTLEDNKFFKGKSMDECVAILLTPSPTPAPPIYWDTEAKDVKAGNTWVFNPRDNDKEELYRVTFIQMWLIEQMRNARNVTERMVFFWHNHFATEAAMVKDSRYCYQYFALMRQHATGNFKKLLKEMTTNPQMLVYLNGNLNVKTAPNENYAREVQELFTVGKGPDSHYNEDDVQQAAKVLTGWKEDKDKIASFFEPTEHNTEDKTFSAFYNNHVIKGREGAAGAEETFELLDMLCAQKEVAKFLCRKLYRWFVNCNIDDKVESNVITPLAEIMIKADYEMKPVLKALLTADFFYEPYLIGSIIKSPIDFITELFSTMSSGDWWERFASWRQEWDKTLATHRR